MSYTYEYPRPAVTVDIILITNSSEPEILLIKRLNEPFKDKWAFPGGFVDPDETLEVAASRELYEETELRAKNLKQFKTYSEPDRDPRGRTISTIFWGEIDQNDKTKTQAGDDAKDAHWFKLKDLPQLAFDHNFISKEFKDFIICN